MSEQGGALGELRAAIERHASARVNDALCGHDGCDKNCDEADDIYAAIVVLHASLAAVEARIAAYERFVRADDAHEQALANQTDRRDLLVIATRREKRAARAALTAEDVGA